jgi:hypothetical protein
MFLLDKKDSKSGTVNGLNLLLSQGKYMDKHDNTELRVKNAESFLKENGALVAIIGTSIDIRKLPRKFLDSLLNGVEACQKPNEYIGANIRREYSN